MCYPVCGMMHIKELLLIIEKSGPCGGSRFPLSVSEWSFTKCLTPYNRKKNVLSASLNKTFLSFLPDAWGRVGEGGSRHSSVVECPIVTYLLVSVALICIVL